MQLSLSNASDAPLPYRYREAARTLDESAASIARAEGEERLSVIEEEASFVFGLISRDLLEKQEAIDRLQQAIVASDAERAYGPDAIQAILARAHVEALREHRTEGLSALKRSVSICAADVKMKPLRWLWKGRIALGKITLLAGNPGLGKSQITIGIAATTTIGGKHPDGSRTPAGSVVFISCEDDYADTVVPRLVAAGAALNKVHVLNWALEADGKQKHFDVGTHCTSLEELCDKLGDVRLVVIDPITAYCGNADTHKTSDVRQALAPLQLLAAEKDVAVIAVSHLNKSASGDPMSRVSGSIAFGAVARSVLLVAADPADDSGRRRYLAPIKNNLGDDETGFAFSVESVTLPDGIETSRVVFESGSVAIAASELLQTQGQNPEERSQLKEAMDLLSDVLSEGPVLRKTVEKKARESDISDITLKRARTKLRIKHKKMKGTGEYVLCLPQHVDQLDHAGHQFGT